MLENVAPEAKPKLAPGVRLKYDDARKAWLLLAPERVIETEGPASEILRRCDGHEDRNQSEHLRKSRNGSKGNHREPPCRAIP